MSEDKKKVQDKIETKTMWLSCNLTDKELLSYADESSRNRIEMLDIEARLSSVKKELQSQVEQKDARIRELATKITSKKEMREVKVTVTHDYKAAKITITRNDTGEMVNTRDMTDAERQTEMAMK